MSYPNARDCKHGSKRGKCDLCNMEERIAELEREAARYRWLVDNCVTRADDSTLPQLQHNVPTTDDWRNHLEDAIDDAIASEKESERG